MRSRQGAGMRHPLLAVVLFIIGACAPPVTPPPGERLPEARLTPVVYADLPGWAEDNLEGVRQALSRSCGRLLAQPADRLLGDVVVVGTVADWRGPCAGLAGLDDQTAALRGYLETQFRPYRLSDGSETTGLFTGYYEAELRGSLRREGRYQTPIYTRPAELVTVDLGQFRSEWRGQRIAGRVSNGRLEPFASRAEIEAGALAGRNLEILWVDDPVDSFFLHIQGSGRVRMPDGSTVRLGYDSQNGHPYVAIGRELVRRGDMSLDQVSMPSIRQWLAAHPDQAAQVMATNPSYVFFRRTEGDGPVGSQGAALTPSRSLAVDRRYVPLGVPVWLDTLDPLDASQPLRRLLVAQDTGGAINGVVRGDIFFGFGATAAEQAGHMRRQGRYYLMVPRNVVPRTALQGAVPGA